MGKRRMIDSKIRESQIFASFTFRQRDLWHGIIVCADDQGRMPGVAAYLRSKIWPYDDINLADVEADLLALVDAGNIIHYEIEGRKYIQIAKWWHYQNMQWAGKSDHPPPDGAWVDRERYHGKGNEIFVKNWDKPGGYAVSLPSGIPSELPSNKGTPREKDGVKNKNHVKEKNIDTAKAVSSFHSHSPLMAERLYTRVTGQMSIPSSIRDEVIEDLISVLDYYKGVIKDATPKGKTIFQKWCNTSRKDGSGKYSPTNKGWIDWWLKELAPQPEKAKRVLVPPSAKMCDVGMRLYKLIDPEKSGYMDKVTDHQAHVDKCDVCRNVSNISKVQDAISGVTESWSVK